jgi:acyl-CoA hydrolase
LVLLRVDQVLFLKPVTVGSVMDLQSKVTLIEEIEGIGKVMRVVTKGYNEHKVQTNNFNFLFAVQDKDFNREILPETFDDILEFHEAKRRLTYERILISKDL